VTTLGSPTTIAAATTATTPFDSGFGGSGVGAGGGGGSCGGSGGSATTVAFTASAYDIAKKRMRKKVMNIIKKKVLVDFRAPLLW
jgi:pectate lyase